jgi:phage terminase large subunit-like protein
LINSAFVNGSIIWGDIPLMRWYTNNVKLEPAPNNCYKYGKIEAKSRKTDGFMAYAAAMTIEDELQEYDMPPILDVIRG